MMMTPEAVAGLPIWVGGILMAGVAIGFAVAVELVARRVLTQVLRADHTPAATAIFTIIGTTYAVLLAFVTMLAWDGFNAAQAATDTEASLIQNVYFLIDGLNGPEMPSMRADIVAYANAVANHEWNLQAQSIEIAEHQPDLENLTRTALHLRPTNIADGDIHTLLLTDLTQLTNARRVRLAAARTSIPGILWFVLTAGGAITIAFASFLSAPSLRMHLAMSSLLGISGALVMLVILALSNPFRGDFRITAEPFTRALAHMKDR